MIWSCSSGGERDEGIEGEEGVERETGINSKLSIRFMPQLFKTFKRELPGSI